MRKLCSFLLVSVLFLPVLAAADPWSKVISEASNSVVSLSVSQLRDFEDADQGVGSATGFVVDAERGIILTNRHVIGAGPISAKATFQNRERVDVYPLYRDPVHDFGFLRYDPKQLKHITPKSLPLVPRKARTGMDIRVVGSDGGEQLSILAGTIAQMQRRAPNYGRYEYNDFNTFYFQAASSTSGGSSGSPVLDASGDVVALNAAANSRTASSFFLPLDRVKRALLLLQQDKAIVRGTLQTVFSHHAFRELKSLGLAKDTEQLIRQELPESTGMLQVKQVLPESPAFEVLQEGDILVSVNQQLITEFIALESLLDDNIGQEVELEIIRQAKTTVVKLEVSDLHALIASEFLELGDAIVQNMSLHHIRGMNLPNKGVIVARDGFIFQQAGIAEDALIVSINGESINSIDDIQALLVEGTEKRWLVRYILPRREFSSEVAEVILDSEWFRYRRCSRQDDKRFWACDALAVNKLKAESNAEPVVPEYKNPLLKKIAKAIVRVDFNIPYKVDNVYAQHFSGTGLVVDAKAGLIFIDRNTIPISMGNVMVTFFGSYEIPAKVVFLNPLHNVALIEYDPAKLHGVEIPELEYAQGNQDLPQELFRVASRTDGTFRINALGNASRVTVVMDDPRIPRFQQAPIDVFNVTNMPPSLGGPVVDKTGKVHALWISFAYEESKEIKEAEWALPVKVLTETLNSYKNNGLYYAIDTRLYYRSLAHARRLGLDDAWLKRYLQEDASQRRVLYIEQVLPETNANTLLQSGDVLLTINDQLVTDLIEAEALSQMAEVELEVLRAGEVLKLSLKTSALTGLGTERFVSWAGATFQEPHREIALYKGVAMPGVYISATRRGSPANNDRLYRNQFVTQVDGQDVSNLDEFLAIVKNKNQDDFTRLTVVSLAGRRDIISVSPEYYFWPTFEIKKHQGHWQRFDY